MTTLEIVNALGKVLGSADDYRVTWNRGVFTLQSEGDDIQEIFGTRCGVAHHLKVLRSERAEALQEIRGELEAERDELQARLKLLETVLALKAERPEVTRGVIAAS